MMPRYLKYSKQSPVPASDDALAGGFTAEERSRIERLRIQFLVAPDSYQLDIEFSRLAFAYWLVQHGYLSEEIHGVRGAQDDEGCAALREDGVKARQSHDR